MSAMLGMKKLDLGELKRAHAGIDSGGMTAREDPRRC